MRLVCVLLTAGILVISACSGDDEEEKTPLDPTSIHGRWDAVYFKIDFTTFQSTDEPRTMEVTEKDWERSMNMQPAEYFFWPDRTYNVQHYNLNDSLLSNMAGKWSVRNDSLVMQDTLPKRGPEYAYDLRLLGDMLELRGIEDSDNDGKRDDAYYGTFRKFKVKAPGQ